MSDARALRIARDALDQPAEHRRDFVREACAGGGRLEADVLRLVAASESEADEMDERAGVGRVEAPFKEGGVIGDFVLISKLGVGSAGEVWEAHDRANDRVVALKILHPMCRLSATRIERFRREGRVGARAGHPALVSVYSSGEAGGYFYIAQELVSSGRTLEDWIRQHRQEAEPSGSRYARVVKIFRRIAEGMQTAHTEGIIHRDLKPSNILLTEADAPKVADFGIAKAVGELGLTRTGQWEGTPFYMSPEQIAGKGEQVDHRSDIFSLGVVLYECLTFRRPFDGDDARDIFHRICHWDPINPRRYRSRIPRDLSVVCLAAMERDRAKRYQTMQALADDLERVAAGASIRARPPSLVRRTKAWVRRQPVMTVYTSLCSVIAGLLVWLSIELFAERADARVELGDARYRDQMALVQLAMRDGRREKARAALGECLDEFRGWEWTYLSRLVSQVSETCLVPEGGELRWAREGRLRVCYPSGRVLEFDPARLEAGPIGLVDAGADCDEAVVWSADGASAAGRSKGQWRAFAADHRSAAVSSEGLDAEAEAPPAAKLSNNGSLLALLDDTGTVVMRDLFTGSDWSLPDPESARKRQRFIAGDWMPDTRVFGAISLTGSVVLWDAVSAEVIWESLADEILPATNAALSLQRQRLMICHSPHYVEVRHLEGRGADWIASPERRCAAALSPDGDFVALATPDVVRILSVDDKWEWDSLRLSGDSVPSLVWSADSTELYCLAGETLSRVDLGDPTRRMQLPYWRQSVSEDQFTAALQLRWFDGQASNLGYDMTVSFDGRVLGIDSTTGRIMPVFEPTTGGFYVYSPTASGRLAVLEWAADSLLQCISIWDPRTKIRVGGAANASLGDQVIECHPTMDLIATTWDDRLRLWQGADSMSGDAGDTLSEVRVGKSSLPAESIRDVQWHDTRRRAVSITRDAVVQLWETEPSFELVEQKRAELPSSPSCLAWNHGAGLIAVGAMDGTIWLVDDEDLQVKRSLRGHLGQVRGMEWSPDGRRLASVGHDGSVFMWDARWSAPVLEQRLRRGPLGGVAWRPDGRAVAVVADGGALLFLELDNHGADFPIDRL